MTFKLTPAELFDDGAAIKEKALAHLKRHGAETQEAAREMALAGALDAAEPDLARKIAGGLLGVWRGHAMIEGERASGDAGEWDAKLEEAIETWCDDTIRKGVGVDGIGEELNKLAAGTEEEMLTWAQGVAGRWAPLVAAGVVGHLTPAKALSAAGIVMADLKPMIGYKAPAAAPAAAPEPPTHSEALATAVKALKGYGDMFGAGSAEELLGFLGGKAMVEGQLLSPDEVMRASACTRFGVMAAAEAFGVLAGKISSGDLLAAVYDTSRVPPMAAAKPPKAAGKSRKRNAPVTPVNKVVEVLRAHAGLKDAELAKAIGLSRQGMVKIATGETGWAPDGPEELMPLRQMLEGLRTAAAEADTALREYGA